VNCTANLGEEKLKHAGLAQQYVWFAQDAEAGEYTTKLNTCC
jgi:hypothetical protein